MKNQSKSVFQLMDELRELGVKIWVENGVIKCRAEKGVLSRDLKAMVAVNRDEIIAYIGEIYNPQLSLEKWVDDIFEEDIPLSFSQQMYWDISFLVGVDNSRKNICLQMSVNAKFDEEKFKEALHGIIQSNSILRTVFYRNKEGFPCQAIKSTGELCLQVLDGRSQCHQGHEEFEQLFHLTIGKERFYQFDLSTLPLFQFVVVQESDAQFRLILTIHKIVSDAAGANTLCIELIKHYKSLLLGEDSLFQRPVVQYAGYAYWQQENYSNNQRRIECEKFWKEILQPTSADWTSIPHDKNLGKKGKLETAKCFTLIFSERISKKIIHASSSHRATVFSILLTAFSIYLSNILKINQVFLYTALSGRSHPYLETMIGSFIRTIKVGVSVPLNPNFSLMLKKLHQQLVQAQGSLDIGNEYMNDHLSSYSEEAASNTPITILMRETGTNNLESSRSFKNSFNDAGFILTFHRAGDQMALSIDYRVEYYSQKTIETIATEYLQFLDEIVKELNE